MAPPQTQRWEDARIFSELYPSLRRYAAVVGPIEVDPDDLLQEAVTRRLRRGPLSDLDDAGAYLRRTMVNLASNHRRRFAVRRRALSRLAASVGDTAVKDAYPSDIADLLRLPPTERAVLYLSEVEGFRYAEIGELLGCSETAARNRAFKGRRRLHAALVGEASSG